MKLFCDLDTSGNIERTNLQLYSLRQAARCWNELIEDISTNGETEIDDLKERLVFIVNCFGLSLSQLLGQNWPSTDQNNIEDPRKLLSNILNSSHIDKVNKKLLNKGFQDLMKVYDAIRHFGKVKNDKNYKLVNELDLSKLDRFRKITIKLWDTVIAIRHNLDLIEIEIDFFNPMAEQVIFNELPK